MAKTLYNMVREGRVYTHVPTGNEYLARLKEAGFIYAQESTNTYSGPVFEVVGGVRQANANITVLNPCSSVCQAVYSSLETLSDIHVSPCATCVAAGVTWEDMTNACTACLANADAIATLKSSAL